MWSRKKLILLILPLLFVLSTPIFAWDATGHKLVAQIAYTNLTQKARFSVDRLTRLIDRKYQPLHRFLFLATWPDRLVWQDDVHAFLPWHFIDQGFSPDGTPVPPPGNQNVVWAIGQMQHVLTSPKPNAYERAYSLVFLVHFVGDIHQPLHCADQVTRAHPQGDEGGNLFPIKDPNGNPALDNLHSFWDQGLGWFQGTSKRYPLVTSQIQRLADKIQADYPQDVFKNELKVPDPAVWAQDGFVIAKTFTYKTGEKAMPTPEYVKKGQKIVERRIALAGYRLAAVLNKIFG